jgi:hypothetical protein
VPARRGSRSTGGSGIGLAVVRGLAEAMGGSARAERSPLGGLAVTVRLPIDEAAEAGRAPEPVGSAEPAEAVDTNTGEPVASVEPVVDADGQLAAAGEVGAGPLAIALSSRSVEDPDDASQVEP